MKTLRNWLMSLLGAWRWNKMSKYSVIRKDEIIVEADSPEEAEALGVKISQMPIDKWNTVAIEVQDGEVDQ